MTIHPVTTDNPVDPTRLSSGDYTSTVVLNRIFRLMLTMITSLQKVAAAQAQRLTILSKWQSAYSDAMAQMHTFSQGDGSFLTASSQSDNRSSVNQYNSNLLQTMQSRQALVGDDAKALQSNVNQSNDAVTQQSNLGTAILQELSTLLSEIFH